MPLYEYKCDKCDTIKDKIIAYKDRKESHPCDVCFNGTMEFVNKIHSGGFILKGNGWYKTDFDK